MVSARAIARPAMRGAGRSVRHRFVRAYALQLALSVSHVHVQLLRHLWRRYAARFMLLLRDWGGR